MSLGENEYDEYFAPEHGFNDGEEDEQEDEEELNSESNPSFGPEEITLTHIKQIAYELGLIILCWPDIKKPVFENRRHFPESYFKNCEKEKLALLYAESFRKQFIREFPKRRQLILAADNECGIQKFVCTTLRPTSLPYEELKSWQSCAQFVADNIKYEPLERATLGPERILGPYTVFKRQLGNSFEMSTCLCSLLIGAGYNAFVVSGYATQDVTQYIMMRTDCPIKPIEDEEAKEAEEAEENKYQLRPIRDLRSKFLLYMAQREIDKVKEAEEKKREKRRQEMRELEIPPPDELYGWRVHSWVLLLPKFDVTEPIFVEPSTGVAYSLDNNVYLSLESIWNVENYWVNLQNCSNGLADLNFDLSDLTCWEHMFLGEPITKRTLAQDAEIPENTPLDEKHLDMPWSWVERIDIPSETLKQRFPNGTKTTMFKRTMLTQYGEYVLLDGLKHKIMYYSNLECTDLLIEEECYENRQDRLVRRRNDIITELTTEYFRRGREDACKIHTYYPTKNIVEAYRVMEFFSDFRLDGLAKLEMDPLYLKETFKNREDKLIFRHATFAERGNPPPGMIEGTRRIVMSVVEKYDRNESKCAHEDIAMREFAIVQNEVYIKYHYAKGKVTASTREYQKPLVAELGADLHFTADMTQGYRAEIGAKPPKNLALYYLLQQMLKDEDKVLHHLRDMEDEVQLFIRTRAIESAVPKLNVSLFNREQNEEYREGLKERELEEMQHKEREVDEEIDYLLPYIMRLGNPPILTKAEAIKVKHECLKDFSHTLVIRANKLRRKFEKELADFQKMQSGFSTAALYLTPAEEEKELQRMADKKYNLQIYDVRLERCRELAAQRYRALEVYISSDKRLVNMHVKK